MIDFYYDEWENFIKYCGFTDEELRIVKYLRKGWAYIDISVELNISLRTLKRRVKNISNKIMRYIAK